MSEPKFIMLLKILDEIKKDAPKTKDFKRFYSGKIEDLNYSRGQAFIHLFLLIKFGLETFEARQRFICDGKFDGGLDAYFISEREKTVYLIQSKFHTTDSSFKAEKIPVSDLVKMELDRIIHGETNDSNGNTYNAKVLEFQLKLNQATQKQVYTHKVIFLANISTISDYQIRKLTSNLDYEVYNYEKSYLELVKSICAGTYYNPDRIIIELDLSEKSTPQLSQTIKSSYGYCDVTAVFVPTVEIGRVMSRYKNAILIFNPRNYLGLSKNQVNKEIRRSISTLKSNDFALLNNGITILADEQEISLTTGKKNVGRLTLTNPQIINGGQTAYTLSDIFEKDYQHNLKIFSGKEVLVRVVVLKKQNTKSSEKKYKFIEAISTSTNQQTAIKSADRHSSNPVLKNIQEFIFKQFGFLLELKQGEFYNGKEKGFINKSYILNRITLLRSFLAFLGYPTAARRHSESQLFNEYDTIHFQNMSNRLPQIAAEMFFAYRVHNYLTILSRKIGSKSLNYGYSLRYGRYAVVYAANLLINNDFHSKLKNLNFEQVEQYIETNLIEILNKWKKFEKYFSEKNENITYFNVNENLTDYDTYYKGTTLKNDLELYFKPKRKR